MLERALAATWLTFCSLACASDARVACSSRDGTRCDEEPSCSWHSDSEGRGPSCYDPCHISAGCDEGETCEFFLVEGEQGTFGSQGGCFVVCEATSWCTGSRCSELRLMPEDDGEERDVSGCFR